MELRRYLRIIGHWWWIVLVTVLVTSGATLALVLPQPAIYESTGTYLIRPRSPAADEQVDASDLLIRGVQIGATYAEIARSDLILGRAEALLGPGSVTSDMSVDVEMLTGTNVLSIGVTGQEPEAVQDLASAIGVQTIRYVDLQTDAYELVPLDLPTLSEVPVGPPKELTIGLGIALGLLLGILLAFFAEYLRASSPSRVTKPGPSTDTAEAIGAWASLDDEEFLGRRLREETDRAARTGQKLSFGVLKVARRGRDGRSSVPGERDLHLVAETLSVTLRSDAVLAYMGDGTFAVMLSDTTRPQADGLLMGWESAVSSILDGVGSGSDPNVTSGSCQYTTRGFVGSRDAKLVVQSLMQGAAPPRPAPTTKRAPKASSTTPAPAAPTVPANGPVSAAKPAPTAPTVPANGPVSAATPAPAAPTVPANGPVSAATPAPAAPTVPANGPVSAATPAPAAPTVPANGPVSAATPAPTAPTVPANGPVSAAKPAPTAATVPANGPVSATVPLPAAHVHRDERVTDEREGAPASGRYDSTALAVENSHVDWRGSTRRRTAWKD